jgi:DNA polymerase IV
MQLQQPLSLRTLFVDFNAYFASVEQQERPELRGKPVGVVPVMAESSSCIAASYEAKRFGVTTGTGVREARRLCPGIEIVEARPALYVAYHHRAVAAVDTIAPVHKVLSVDEMACELTGRWREPARAMLIAEQIKHVIWRDVGSHLRVSIGIAPNILLGKLASDMQKPDGLIVIAPEHIPAAFLHLPVSAISGIGPRMTKRLALEDITTMQSLFDAPREQLHRIWGGMGGDEMYDKIRGVWYEPRETATQSLGHSHVLPPELRTAASAYSVLTRLTQKAAMRLRRQGFYATAMTVQVRCTQRGDDAPRPSCAQDGRFSETQDTRFFLHTLQTLWAKILASHIFLQGKPLSIGLVLHGLVPASQHTASLFDAACSPRGTEQLLATVDKLNVQYGKNTLYYAAAHDVLDRAPMRIAFTRIPDLATET